MNPGPDDVGWWWWKEPDHSALGSQWECVLVAKGGFIRVGLHDRWPINTEGTWGAQITNELEN